MKMPMSESQWGRLKEAMEWSDRQLEFPKRKRLESIKEFTGYHYSEGGASKRVPVPMIQMAVQVYIRLLAAREPRALFTTKDPSLKSVAANMQLAINMIPEEIGLASTLRRLVMEALFSYGIVKVGLNRVGTALDHEYGQTFVDLVTLDDYFMDMSAKHEDAIDFEGNSYWMDFEELKKADWIDKGDRDLLKPDEHTTIGPAGEARAEGISTDNTTSPYRERIWLRDVWLPREGLLLTMGNISKELLKVVEWTGPKCGPYYKLGYSDVPGNLLPLPPVSLWRDLHELSNTMFRKLGSQAEAAKSVMGFQGGDDEEALNFKNALDGSGIRYTGALPNELKTSGVDAKTLAFYLQCKELFSYYCGNLDQLGGLGTQTQTLGQDKLLNEAASSQMRDMSDKTVEVIRKIFRALAFYEWNDPIKRRILEKPIPGLNASIQVEFGRDQKRGDFDMYDLDIDIYSLQDNSPGARLQKLGVIMAQYVIPLGPMIEQGSGTINVKKIMQMVAQYSDFPELGEVVEFIDTAGPLAPSANRPMKPSNTVRTEQRIGQPGMSRQGADATLSQQLLAGGMEE
jgi:hypothetical protein